MSEIRLLSEADFDDFISIVGNAYPGFPVATPAERDDLKKRFAQTQFEDPVTYLYGLFRDDKLLGGMRLFDFTMNMAAAAEIQVGGVGLVAVDLFHKKEKVAKEMIAFYLRHYREQGANLAALYPFRPDFYKQMGFGFGAKMNQYRVKPSSLPKAGNRRNVRPLVAADQGAMLACYNRFFKQTHGLFEKYPRDFEHPFANSKLRVVGYWRDDQLTGYSVFEFGHGVQLRSTTIELLDFVYTDREALAGLLSFFQSQDDQVETITINTQDALFHHLLLDVRSGGLMHVPPVAHESNTAGVGIMYRVIDTAGIFQSLSGYSFNGQNCAIKFSVADSFLPENDRSVVVHFCDGLPNVQSSDDHEVEIRLDIAEFSSLLMGVVPFSKLYLYGLAEISDTTFIDQLDRLFATPTPPVCMSRF